MEQPEKKDLWALVGIASKWYLKHRQPNPQRKAMSLGIRIYLLLSGHLKGAKLTHPDDCSPPKFAGVKCTPVYGSNDTVLSVYHTTPTRDAPLSNPAPPRIAWIATCDLFDVKLWSEHIKEADLEKIVKAAARMTEALKPYGLKIQARLG